jgi:trehalose-6-phosphate synthase
MSRLHDGMNLVAKEFVAARDDEQGTCFLANLQELPRGCLRS